MFVEIAEAYLFPCTSIGMIQRDVDGNYRWVDSDTEYWYQNTLDDVIKRIQSRYEGREILIRPTENM